MSLIRQVEQATHAWAAKGHKANRARQRRMMMAFAGHAEALGAREKGQVGGRTVISYFKALRAANRAYATQMDHWRAIRELWQLWGKPGEPPRPREPGEQPAGGRMTEGQMLSLMDAGLTRDTERAVFGLPPRQAAAAAPEGGQQG